MNDDIVGGAHHVIASVAAAYASRPDVSADQILGLVARLSAHFGGVGESLPATQVAARAPAGAPAQPALPVDRAVTKDRVYCLCCGKGFKMLKRHLGSEHGLTEEEYRAEFGLPADFPLVAPSYSERKAAYARKVGLGKYSRAEANV